MKTKQIITLILVLIAGVVIGKYILSDKTKKEQVTEHANHEEHWTCSMHPQIDLPEFGACPICGMDLILKETDNDENQSIDAFKMSKHAQALANIQTIIVGETTSKIKNEEGTLQLSGKIEANSKQTAIQTAHFGGRIESLKYRSKGEYVTKGSLVATLYSPELVTAQNEFIEALEIKNSQPELYQAVRNKLKNWKISEKQIQQIEQTKKVKVNFNMYANVSGYISELLVEEGNHVKEGSPMFKVANLGSVWAVFDVYEQDIKHLKKGQQIEVTLNAFPNKIIKSKIDYIDPLLNTKTRTVSVRATLINKKNKLKPGMLLIGQLKLKKATNNHSNKLVVPKTAILWTGKRSVLYVKNKNADNSFELREIMLGATIGNTYQIVSGLSNGEEIVVNGAFTVDAAAQLQGKRSMMNAAKEKEITHKKEETMKCGEGKCGDDMKKESKPEMKCGEGKCGDAMKK